MAINLSDLLRKDASTAEAIQTQISLDQTKVASLAAANEAQKLYAAADAQARTANFARVGNVEELLLQQVQEFNRSSAETQIARANAAQKLQDLEESSSASIIGDPLGWLNNQLTFDDRLAQTKLSVGVAEAKDAQTKDIQGQITALNQMTQQASQTFNAMAQSVTAETAQRESDRIVTLGSIAANNAKLEGIKAGNDLRLRARQLELQEEDQKMQRERQAWAKQEHDKHMEASKADKNAFDKMWQAAEIGSAELGRPIGPKPASRQEFELIYKTNPNLQAAITTGWNKIAGKSNVLGSDVAESAAMLKATDAQGNEATKKQVSWLKSAMDSVIANPKVAAAPKESQQAEASKLLKQEFVNASVNADANPDKNPARLPAVAAVLNRTLPANSAPDVIALQQRLLASPMVKDLMQAQLHLQDKPQAIIEFASAWAKDKGASVSDVSNQVAEMFALTRQYQNEANRSVGLPAVTPKYSSPYGFFKGSFDPADPKAIQDQITAGARKVALDRARAANQTYTFGGKTYGAD